MADSTTSHLQITLLPPVPHTTILPSTESSAMATGSAITSINPGGPIISVSSNSSAAGSTSINPGGPISSAVTNSSVVWTSTIPPGINISVSTGTETGTAVTGTGLSTSVSSTPTYPTGSSAGVGRGANMAEPGLVGLVALVWMGVWGFRTMLGRQ